MYQENNINTDGENAGQEKVVTNRPSVYDYNNFRAFINDSYLYLRGKNASFSETAFLRKSGFSENCRGYFRLLIIGERNLASSRILGLSKTLKLNEKETAYFENLVCFNQAKTEEDKRIYFERLKKNIKGKETEAYNILKGQYEYMSHWYYAAIKEMVELDDFKLDVDYIKSKLKQPFSRKEIQQAVDTLLKLEIIEVQNGVVTKSKKHIVFDESLFYTAAQKFLREILEVSMHELLHEEYNKRSFGSLTFSTDSKNFPKIREDIKTFRKKIVEKYATDEVNSENPNELTDVVLNFSTQLIYLTNQKVTPKEYQ